MDIQKLIAALTAELEGYKRRGLTDRVRQVEDELRRLNGTAPRTAADSAPVKPASTVTAGPVADELEPPAAPAKKPVAKRKPR